MVLKRGGIVIKELNIGDFRKRIIFQTYTDSVNSINQHVPVPANYATVWGKIAPVNPLTKSGGVYLDANKADYEVTYLITIRYHSGITPKMIVKYGSQYFKIAGIVNVEERNQFLEITCIETVAP
jgi:SPP1 family predicted phage head-tail adaptor